jgi:hypothetical protein
VTSYRVTIRARGPMFTGLAEQAIDAWARDTEEELANQGQAEIRRRTRLMRRSNSSMRKIRVYGYRAHTGAAERHVRVYSRAGAWYIAGESREGEVWWPWLEGTSKRNLSSRFKGYHTFRIVKNLLQRRAKRVGEEILQRYKPRMGD